MLTLILQKNYGENAFLLFEKQKTNFILNKPSLLLSLNVRTSTLKGRLVIDSLFCRKAPLIELELIEELSIPELMDLQEDVDEVVFGMDFHRFLKMSMQIIFEFKDRKEIIDQLKIKCLVGC